MTRHAAAILAATMVSAAALAGCSSGESETPVAFTSRTDLPSCGSIVLEQGEPIALPAEILDCLAAPAGGEVMLEAPTDEGDPIQRWYRVGPGIDGVEYFTDNTQDTNGEQIWLLTSCPRATVQDLAAPNAMTCGEPSGLVEG